jgi:pyrroline-5-carboxylate reductase
MTEEIDLKNLRFAFIGSGIMAEAMISTLLNKELVKPENLNAAGPRVERGEELQARYGIVPFTDNSMAVFDADIIILSVKPQKLSSVLQTLDGSIKHSALIITIVAGASINKIRSGLGHDSIVRAMPNTPAQIGAGITVWTASKSVSTKQLDQTKKIISALGEEVFLEDEANLDMATALSGTGPAYVYLFMEALIDSGVHLGFSRRIAEQLVIKTIQGSIEFYTKSDLHLSALRNAVTSPGGTSAEALYFLDKAGFRTAISRAVWAAYERTLELGSDHPNNTNQIHS